MSAARTKPKRDHTTLAIWLFVLAALWLSVGAVSIYRAMTGRRSQDTAITTIIERHSHSSDGRTIHIQIGQNENHVVKIVLIRESARPLSRDDPAMGHLASTTSLVAHNPPDVSRSGIWIDGRKRQLAGESLMVIYVSERMPATQIPIPVGRQSRFLEDVRSSDCFALLTKWKIPPPPSPATTAASGDLN